MGDVRFRILILFLFLSFAEPRWRSLGRPKPQQNGRVIPKEIDRTQLAHLQLPNHIFCAQIEKKATGIYILMPWWYHYCQDLKEKRAKSFNNANQFYKPIYRAALDQLQWYRRNRITLAPILHTKRFIQRL